MNSITQSPGFALDLAHAVIEQRLRDAATVHGPSRLRARRAAPRRRAWPTRLWTARPAAAL
jgi:hypothetical protein